MRHGDYLTVTTLIRDPAFLTEPLVRSQTWTAAPAQRLGRDVCVYVPELVGEPDYVPNHLPGTNPFLREVHRLVRTARGRRARRQRDAVPGIPEDHALAGRAAAAMRALLPLRRIRPRLQPAMNGAKPRQWAMFAAAAIAAPLCEAQQDFVGRRAQRVARARQRLHDRRRRRQHHACKSATKACCWSTRVRAARAANHGRDQEAHERADALHHQHARPSGSCRRQRGARPSSIAAEPARAAADRSRTRTCSRGCRIRRRARPRRRRAVCRPIRTSRPPRTCISTAKRCSSITTPNAHTDGDTHRAVPRIRCRQHRRHVHAGRLSVHRPRTRRQRARA